MPCGLPMQSKEPRPCRAEATPVDLSHGRTRSFERLASSELPRSCIPPWAGGSLRPAQVHPDTVVNVELLRKLRDSTARQPPFKSSEGTRYCLAQVGRSCLYGSAVLFAPVWSSQVAASSKALTMVSATSSTGLTRATARHERSSCTGVKPVGELEQLCGGSKVDSQSDEL